MRGLKEEKTFLKLTFAKDSAKASAKLGSNLDGLNERL